MKAFLRKRLLVECPLFSCVLAGVFVLSWGVLPFMFLLLKRFEY